MIADGTGVAFIPSAEGEAVVHALAGLSTPGISAALDRLVSQVSASGSCHSIRASGWSGAGTLRYGAVSEDAGIVDDRIDTITRHPTQHGREVTGLNIESEVSSERIPCAAIVVERG